MKFKYKEIFLRIVVLILLIYCMMLCVATVLLGDTINDEHMYLAAASLVSEKSIYKDFSYLQSPYMPYFYSIFHNCFNFKSLFTSARLFKALIIAIFILVMYNLLLLLSKNTLISLMCVLILVNNDIFLYTIQFCRNYDLALLFTILGIFVLISPVIKNRYLKIFLAGFFIGLSIGTKLTYILVPVCFIIPWVLEHGMSRISFKKTALLCSGIILGLIPMFVLMSQAGLDISYYNNIGFHKINTAWRVQTGYSNAMNFDSKLKYAIDILTSFSTAVIFLLLIMNLTLSFFMKNRKGEFKYRIKLTLFAFISILMFMVPTPLWESYFVTFIISLFLLVCYFFPGEDVKKRILVHVVTLIVVLLLVIPNFKSSMNKILNCVKPELWTSSRVNIAACAIKALISEKDSDLPIATLTPLYALEAGFKTYPEFSSGPFSYRSAGLLSVEKRKKYNIISEYDLPGLFNEKPPAAILTGFQREVEKGFVKFAEINGYKGFPIVEGPYDAKRSFGIIYIKLNSNSKKNGSDKKLDLMYKKYRQYLNLRPE
ncbi:glycosyltransferase family 39 protein [bacterium]|nr:glycosyltransferase family 39 protein [bacterium]